MKENRELIVFSLLLLLLVLITGWYNSRKLVYHKSAHYGYFIDSLTGKPVQGVIVRQLGSSIVSISDSNGYFEIPYEIKLCNPLSLYKKDYISDTVRTYIEIDGIGRFTIMLFQGQNIILKRNAKIAGNY